jgi:acyl carrier protein
VAGDKIVNTLKRILSEILRIDEDKITPDMAIHETATWNSLTHIELVVMIEDGFDIQLTEDDIVAMTSVDKIQKVLTARGVLPEK